MALARVTEECSSLGQNRPRCVGGDDPGPLVNIDFGNCKVFWKFLQIEAYQAEAGVIGLGKNRMLRVKDEF